MVMRGGRMNQPIIRKGRKFAQVLDGARSVFMRDGYEGASVDDIAREANVSKATLYSYFPDKRLLFIEVARAECTRQTMEAEALIGDMHDPVTVLTVAGNKIVEFFLSPFFLRVYRVCAAESERFPEIGQQFYESGAAQARARLVKYLNAAEACCDLSVPDKELAADQFMELCKGDLFSRALFGVGEPATAADRARVVKGAVEMFVMRYGVKD
jgi:TetR/AcrR family transcriptional regulator, mexJK operon transcriptional repressor